MNVCSLFLRATSAAALVFCTLPATAQQVPDPTPLSRTVSIGDVIRAEDTQAAVTHIAALPIHIVYVHGMNDIGANDSAMLRHAICRYVGECDVRTEAPLYADGPFALNSPPPDLTFLEQPIWANQQEWAASAPFIVRYRISGHNHAPIVLDEINWYPLVYPLKCKFLLPGDARQSGVVEDMQSVCVPPANREDPASPGRFLSYRWVDNSPIFTTDLPTQHATIVNRSLKINVMDWGFGDAVITLGPMREVLTAAIRQLLAQSLKNIIPGAPPGAMPDITNEHVPVFFVTHSLGSYLALTSLDSAWLNVTRPQVPNFALTAEQSHAVDFLAWHTTGFYFLANQIRYMELGNVAPAIPAPQPDCSLPAAGTLRQAAEPAIAALAHYGCMRRNYLITHPGDLAREDGQLKAAPQNIGPQIIAWSAADDALSWYVPIIHGVAVVNLPARNRGFRIPKLIASPIGAHNDYAENPAIDRQIFNPTPSTTVEKVSRRHQAHLL